MSEKQDIEKVNKHLQDIIDSREMLKKELEAFRKTKRGNAENYNLDKIHLTLDVIDDLPEQYLFFKKPDHRISWANKKAALNAGIPQHELIGCLCYEVFEHSESPCKSCPVLSAFADGQPHHKEQQTSENKIISIYAFPFKKDGKVIGVLEYTTILDDVRSKDIELKRSEKRYRRIIEQNNDAITIISMDGKIVEVNKKACEMLGYSESEMLGFYGSELMHISQHDDAREKFELLTKGETLPVYERLFVKKDGSILPVEITVSTVFCDDDDKPEYIISFLRDITERKNYEASLKEAIKKAEESDKLKSLFLTNMSHEIRTPLNAIVGFSKLLKENLSQKEREEFVQIIDSSSKRLLGLINDVLDLSKLKSGTAIIESKTFLVNELIDEIGNKYQSQIEAKALELHLHKDLADDDSEMKSAYYHIKQIFDHLITNAIKFTNHGSITIGYYAKSGRIEFFVKDTGIGISSEKQEMIFESFSQVETDINNRRGGTGLGLAISNAILEKIGGNKRLESALGEGATFYFDLPMRIAERTSQSPTNRHPNISDLRDATILIAEDEEINYMLLVRMLKKCNVNILWADNGSQVIKIIEKNPKIDIILMDIKMPIMDGIECARIVRDRFPNIKIIGQSAYSQREEQDNAIAAGFDDYIVKPIKRDKLIEKILKLLPTL